MSAPTTSEDAAASASRSASALIAVGILLSRLAGLVREAVFAAFLGVGPAADAFAVATRIPNTLQMLLGEGTLSASFIPVYSSELDRDEQEAGRIAGAVATLLALTAAILVLIAVVGAEGIAWVIAAGFRNDARFDLTVTLLRITFPAAGITVLGAWCLGILNSHRQFFLSYVAPVLWNLAQITAVVVGVLAFGIGEFDGPRQSIQGVEANVELLGDLARVAAWGFFVGAILQFLVQVPSVRSLARHTKFRFDVRREGVREVIRRFGGAVLGRGVVQISALVDIALAGLLVAGAASALGRSQILYILPISIFAISVAASELPELSRMTSDDEIRTRAHSGFARILFFVCFAATAYVLLGDKIVATLYERGSFTSDETLLVWFVLGVYALGLPAAAASRLTQNTLWSRGDTKGPARAAIFRLVIGASIAVATMWFFDRVDTTDIRNALPTLFDGERNETLRFGAVGITLGSAVASWVEAIVLGRLASKHVSGLSPFGALRRLAPAMVAAAVVAIIMRVVTDDVWPPLAMVFSVGLAGLTYVGVAYLLRVKEVNLLLVGPLRRLRIR